MYPMPPRAVTMMIAPIAASIASAISFFRLAAASFSFTGVVSVIPVHLGHTDLDVLPDISISALEEKHLQLFLKSLLRHQLHLGLDRSSHVGAALLLCVIDRLRAFVFCIEVFPQKGTKRPHIINGLGGFLDEVDG